MTTTDLSAPRLRLESLGGTRFTDALKIRPLTEDGLTRLATPEESRRFTLPIRMDDGNLRMLTAWRVRYSSALGPTKGGVRFTPHVTEEQLFALAFRLVLKCAINGLPHGGAGGAVAVSPEDLSMAEREQVARRYVDALGPDVAPDRDILSPDIGTDVQTMSWMADQYTRTSGVQPAAAINGKPVALGGIPGRPGATARGAWVVLKEVLDRLGWQAEGLTFAVQGYGSAGGHLAVLLAQRGLRLVAAADRSCGWIAPDGLDAEALWAAKSAGRRFSELEPAGAGRVASMDVLCAAADIVIPAATANQITGEVASRLRGRLVLEIANGPVAPPAEPVLSDRQIVVVPDLVANAGGITMSHFEWAQNMARESWSEADARRRLDARMLDTARAMIETSRARNVSFAVAAQLLAIQRLESSIRT
jgi:glutamate dehydrogenase (NADP+)